MATREQLDERRVKDAHKKYREAREKVDAHMNANKAVFDKLYELADGVNTTRKRLEQAVRETGIGVGPITVVHKKHVEYDTDYLEKLFKDDPILSDLIRTKKTVSKEVFESLVVDGKLSKTQASKAVINVEDRSSLTGVPAEIVLP